MLLTNAVWQSEQKIDNILIGAEHFFINECQYVG